jgi:hypothetical protein
MTPTRLAEFAKAREAAEPLARAGVDGEVCTTDGVKRVCAALIEAYGVVDGLVEEVGAMRSWLVLTGASVERLQVRATIIRQNINMALEEKP